MFASAVSHFVRECFIDASPSGVWIDAVPNCFSARGKFRKHMPIRARSLQHCERRRVQADFVFAGAAVPDCDGAFAATAEILPEVFLMRARSPSLVRNVEVDDGHSDNAHSNAR